MVGTTIRPPGPTSQSGPSGQVVLRLRLIGQMEAWTITSENVLPAGRKTRALLAVVALSVPAPRPARPTRRTALEQTAGGTGAGVAAAGNPPPARTLSPAGAEIMQVTRDHLSLRSSAVWVDVDEVMRATTDQPASLSLLDGDLLEDLDGIDPTFDAWLTTERERLRDRARNVAEALLRESNEPESAIPAAQRLLQIDRAHEGAWRALMRAHVARGERGMAIQAYDRCRAVLADLLDAAPSQETQKLLAEIRGPYGSRCRASLAAAGAAGPGRAAPAAPRRSTTRMTNRWPCSSRGRSCGMPAAAPMSACCRCSFPAPRRRRRIWHRARRGNHHGTVALPLDVRRGLQLARPLRRRNPGTRGRSAAPSASTSWWTARSSGCATASASPSACSICAPATRWSGPAASIARPTTC